MKFCLCENNYVGEYFILIDFLSPTLTVTEYGCWRAGGLACGGREENIRNVSGYVFGEWKCSTICIGNKKYLDLCVLNVVGLGLLESCL